MPAKKPELVPLSPDVLEALQHEEKQLEAWHLSITGHSQAEIGRRFGVAASTVGRWLDQVGIERRSRAENIDRETERIIGMLEAAAGESWQRAQRAGDSSMAGPSHMKNFIESAKEIARLRGIEPTRGGKEGGAGRVEVVVNIGGGRTPVVALEDGAIDVEARELSA